MTGPRRPAGRRVLMAPLALRVLPFFLVFLLMGWITPRPVHAAAPDGSATLRVATKPAPPFSFKRADGEWTGQSIELWRNIAEELGRDFELHETDLQGMLDGVAAGEYDVGVAAITVTSEREQVLDFSHPFYTTGLAIALPAAEPSVMAAIVGVFFSWTFLQLVLGLGLLFVVVGALMWLVERRANPQFGESPREGIGNGFWWTVVTMTTVGYGDKTPRTVMGRVLALGWMLASIVIISSFTATVAARMTVDRLELSVAGASDLPKVRVGTVANTTSEKYLRAEHMDFRTYADVTEGLEDLTAGEIEAFVYDAPLLEPAVARGFADRVRILPNTFQRQDYAFALPTGSPLREEVNRVLPEKMRELGGADSLPNAP